MLVVKILSSFRSWEGRNIGLFLFFSSSTGNVNICKVSSSQRGCYLHSLPSNGLDFKKKVFVLYLFSCHFTNSKITFISISYLYCIEQVLVRKLVNNLSRKCFYWSSQKFKIVNCKRPTKKKTEKSNRWTMLGAHGGSWQETAKGWLILKTILALHANP